MERPKRRFRLEIEGLRAVAALLVAIYHIWFNRVSGGVDVFFVISGFLITTSLFSTYAREGTFQPFAYLLKLVRRLAPNAWTVALVSLVVSLFVLPTTVRSQLVSEWMASMFYFENIRLAIDAVDYLGATNDASVYQHFWALGIQFQFYIIWAVLFGLGLLLVRLFTWKERVIVPLFGGMIVIVLIGSFIYSIVLTGDNQPVAYYHPLARVWEFALGAGMALVLPHIRLPKAFAFLLGWVGLIGLIACGIVFQVATVFPGYAALWPTLCAVFILAAGKEAEQYSAYALLSSRPLVSFGQISYAFYLWHWPVLIMTYAITGTKEISFVIGLLILIVSAALAYATTMWIERPLRSFELDSVRTFALVAFVAVLVIGGGTYWEKSEQNRLKALAAAQEKEALLESIPKDHPGALINWDEDAPYYDPDKPLLPPIELAERDLSDVYEDRCITRVEQTNVVSCAYGETKDYDYTIALVGGSHAAHWQPMLDAFGKANRVKIETHLKPRCRFVFNSKEDGGSCAPWFDEVMDRIVASKPDLVFTTGDVGKDQRETVPKSFVETWRYLEMLDIDLFLMRDSPWYDIDIPQCLAEHPNDPMQCKVKRSDVIVEPSPMSKVNDLPSNVHYLDVTDYYCDEEYCYPVVGNVITHFDTNHYTATFSRSFARIIGPEIMDVLEGKKKGENENNEEVDDR